MIKSLVNKQDLENFSAKCDALCCSKLILADKKISDLLKTIAASEDFCRLLEECLIDFNYKQEFLKSKHPDSKKQGKFEIILPNGKDLIAYVFCLLCDFENKEKDLTRFLTEFYGFEELFNDGFSNFCSKVIAPFKNTMLFICSSAEQEQDMDNPDYKLEYQELSIGGEDYLKINRLYKELIRNINKEGQLNSEERKDYIKVASAFLSAYGKKDLNLSEILLTALKCMCKDCRFLLNKVCQIEKIYKASDAHSL